MSNVMDFKYRILEDANGKSLIQRGRFFIWQYRNRCSDWDFALCNWTRRFDSRDEALIWLNNYVKTKKGDQQHARRRKTIVKCTTLSFDDE